jgi:hypothetical protein
MRIALGEFACAGLRSHIGEGDISPAVQVALSRYTRELRSGQVRLPFPRFLRSQAQLRARTYDVPVDAEVEAALEREASSQGTTSSHLAVQAVLSFLAEEDRAGWSTTTQASALGLRW